MFNFQSSMILSLDLDLDLDDNRQSPDGYYGNGVCNRECQSTRINYNLLYISANSRRKLGKLVHSITGRQEYKQKDYFVKAD